MIRAQASEAAALLESSLKRQDLWGPVQMGHIRRRLMSLLRRGLPSRYCSDDVVDLVDSSDDRSILEAKRQFGIYVAHDLSQAFGQAADSHMDLTADFED